MAKIGELLGADMTDYDDRILRRGEIYFINLEDINEVTRHVSHKNRPALIISNDRGNTFGHTVVVALLTSAVKKDYPFQYKLSINGRETIIMCEQILTLDRNRILEKYHELTPIQMKEVEQRLCYQLELNRLSLENIHDIDVVSVITKKTKTAEKIDFEIEIKFTNAPTKTISVPLEKLKTFNDSINQNTTLDELKTILDNCRGLGWLFRNTDIVT